MTFRYRYISVLGWYGFLAKFFVCSFSIPTAENNATGMEILSWTSLCWIIKVKAVKEYFPLATFSFQYNLTQ